MFTSSLFHLFTFFPTTTNGRSIMRATALRSLVLLSCLAAGVQFNAHAQDVPKQLRLAPGDIEFPAVAGGQAGTSGNVMQVKVLSGDPKKPGLYTMVVKAGPNITIKPHAHPDNRVAIVVAGTFYFAYGDEFDETKLKAMPAGSFYTEPPGNNHFAMTKDDGVTLYITGTGPTGTAYVNPADDPAKK
jgi:quercetin dioxygenase-like cupin family protein